MLEIYFYLDKIELVSDSFYDLEDSKDDKFLIKNKLSRISFDGCRHKTITHHIYNKKATFGYYHNGTPEELALFILKHSDMIYKIVENA